MICTVPNRGRALAAELGKTQAPFLEGVPRLVGELQGTQLGQHPVRGQVLLEGSLSRRVVPDG